MEHGEGKFDDEELTWRQKLKIKLWKVVSRFNKWIEKHKLNINKINRKVQKEVNKKSE
jgi:hypothetical protein